MKTIDEVLAEIRRLIIPGEDALYNQALLDIEKFILSDSDCNHEWSGTEWDYCIKCKYEKPVPGQACEHEWSRVHDINVCLKCKKREAYSK